MADAATIKALGGLELQLRKLVALGESSHVAAQAGDPAQRAQFVGTGPGGNTVNNSGEPQRKQFMKAQLVEFSPTGLKQLMQAMNTGIGQEKPTSHLAQARRWGWIKKVLGWAGLLSTIYYIWQNWDSIKAFFVNLWPSLKKGWNWMRDKATKFWKKYWPKVKAGLIDAWGTVSKFCIKIWDRTVVPWLNKTGKKMAAWVKKTYEKVIVPGVNKAWRRLTDQVGKWWASILKWWRGTSKESSSWWSETWKEIETGWNVVVKKFKEWWDGSIQPWVDRVGTLINTYWEATKELVTTWFYAKVWLNILRGWEYMRAMFTGFGTGIATIWGESLELLQANLKIAIISGIGKVIIDAKEVWRDVLDGLRVGAEFFIDGISAMLKAAFPKLGAIAGITGLLASRKKEISIMGVTTSEAIRLNARRDALKRDKDALDDRLKDLREEAAKKTAKPVKSAVDELTKSRLKAFDALHKSEIEKGDKALENFRKQTKGATDIFHEAGDKLLTASEKFQQFTDKLVESTQRSSFSGQMSQQEFAEMIGRSVAAASPPATGSSPTIIPIPGNTGGSSYQSGTSQLRRLNA